MPYFRCIKYKSLTDSWFVIINPHAGGGKGRIDWPAIEGLLVKHSINFTYVFTEHKHHAVELAVASIKRGYRRIIAVGGDGTLNEIVNGLFIQKTVPASAVTIGVIAVGTGNDWIRMCNIPAGYENYVKAIKDENVFRQDVGRVEYTESRIQQHRYFVNAAGIGFDAQVVLYANRMKDVGKRGALLYVLSLLKTLVRYQHTKIAITVDGQSAQESTFSLTVGIGPYSGAGMMQVPNAVANDGLYDVTMIRKISKWRVLLNIHRLYNGTILNHPKTSSYRGSTIEIVSNPPVLLEADGESLGESPFRFTLLPRAINVVVGEKFISQHSEAVVNYSAEAV